MLGLDIKHTGCEYIVSCSSHTHFPRNTTATCWDLKVLGTEILFTVSDWLRIVQRGQISNWELLCLASRGKDMKTWVSGSQGRKRSGLQLLRAARAVQPCQLSQGDGPRLPLAGRGLCIWLLSGPETPILNHWLSSVAWQGKWREEGFSTACVWLEFCEN